jgi:general secretion pathway protein G
MANWRTYLLTKTFRVARDSTPERLEDNGGFTIIELVLVVAIVGILSTLAIPNYLGFLEKARAARTVAELNAISKDILGYAYATGQYPDSLAQIGWDQRLDRWGNPYQYLRIDCTNPLPLYGRLDNIEPPHTDSEGLVLPASVLRPPVNAHVSLAVDMGKHQGRMYLVAQGGNGNGGCGSGQPRKDHFLHPISSDFDLYSMGADGQSVAPLTAQKSRAAIIRANDGSYYGLASNF